MKFLENFSGFRNTGGLKRQNLKVGDYIRISNNWRSAYDAKVIDIIMGTIGTVALYVLQEENGKISHDGLRNIEISYLPPEEIEDFEMRLNTNKYNL